LFLFSHDDTCQTGSQEIRLGLLSFFFSCKIETRCSLPICGINSRTSATHCMIYAGSRIVLAVWKWVLFYGVHITTTEILLFYKQRHILRDFRLPTRCKWDLRSSGILRSVDYSWTTWASKMGPIGCSETSVTNYQHSCVKSQKNAGLYYTFYFSFPLSD
jgi:hypothetical protein